jgi:hypothetical protein
VFHFEISALNVRLSANTDARLVADAVFQSPMLPYVVVAVVGLATHAVGLATHAVTVSGAVPNSCVELSSGSIACRYKIL